MKRDAGWPMTSADIAQVGVGFVVMGALGYVVKLSMCWTIRPFTIAALFTTSHSDS